jgi:hypothetical protein
MLSRYVDAYCLAREIVARPGAGGSVLVLDQCVRGGGERRLLAHISADEPTGNPAIVCRRFLVQARRERCRCRSLTPEDLTTVPFSDDIEEGSGDCSPDGPPRADNASQADHAPQTDGSPQTDGLGCSYRLECFPTGMSIPELRWGRRRADDPDECRAVSIREAIASLERYEPVCALTARALARHEREGDASITVLRAELRRMRESPIVLNRRLRDAVLGAVERGASMSEIAMRCGRIKRDAAGNESGETSWLARRLGLLAEGGRKAPTPWIHSDVLALIARDGLGVSPREVEAD